MHQFARTIGYLSLVSGILLVVFPEATRRLMLAREELAHLSPTALRLLGSWYFLTGALLVAITTKPAAQITTTEFVEPKIRKAA